MKGREEVNGCSEGGHGVREEALEDLMDGR